MDVNITLRDTKMMNRGHGNAYQHLKNSHLFTSLSDDQLDRVCTNSITTKLKDGQSLFKQGDEVKRFYLVKSGKIKLFCLSSKGQEKIIDLVSEGNMFAEALMFMDRAHYPVSASAISDSEVIGIDSADFKAMLRDSVDTCFLLLADMSIRLKSLIHEIDTLSLQTGNSRVAAYILDNAPEDVDKLKLNIPKHLIASRVSVKPETFSRILKELCEKQILSVKGTEITILNRSALEALSCST
jgi:CRP-like cAMP-binding protein